MVVGVVAGYLGGRVDTVIALIIDVVLSIPFLLAGIAIVSIVGPSLTVTIIVIAFFSWSSIARIVRGQVLSIREREYVEAARSLGASDWRIMFVDVLPNVLAPVIVYTTLLIPLAIVSEATLSFLGLGVPAPTATWGGMLDGSLQYYRVAWWYLLFPGLALLITTLAFNIFGDGVRDAFDPRTDRLFAAETTTGVPRTRSDPLPRPARPARPARHLADHAGAVRHVLRGAQQRRADPRRPPGHPGDDRADQPAARAGPAASGSST